MNVVVTGANSAVGQAILRAASQPGPQSPTLVAAVRSERAADKIRSLVSESHRLVQISYDDAKSIRAAFDGADALIHLAGVLIETPGSSYERANVSSTRSVVEVAQRCRLRKLVLVSATGADDASPNRYYRTKGQAERLVRESGLPFTILRAPLLLGAGTAGAAALTRNVAGPTAKLIGGGRNLQQPLHVDDLARAALAATQPSVATNLTLDLVGPVSLPERELVERAARFLGREVRIGSIPKSFLSLALGIRQIFSKPAFSRDALAVVTADTQLDPQRAARELRIELTGIDDMIRSSVGA